MKDKKRESPQLNSSANSAVTQVVPETKSTRRSKQIKILHLQFEDMKKKIKDLESRNVKIIQNFHKYDFNKKPQKRQAYEANPIVHYEQQQEESQLLVQRSKMRDSSEEEPKKLIKKNSHIKKNAQPSLNQSSEYRRTIHHPEEREQSYMDNRQSNGNLVYRPKMATTIPSGYSPSSEYLINTQQQFHVSQFNGLSPYQYSMQFPAYTPTGPPMNQDRSFEQNNYKFEQALRREREKVKILQQELQERQGDIVTFKKLQKKTTHLTAHYNETIQICLQEFFDDVLKKRLGEIDKSVRRNENRLKKIQLRIKDKAEDKRSRWIISEHQEKRSQSRSKKSKSPRDFMSTMNPVQRLSSKRSTYEPSIPNHDIRSKQSEPSKPSEQFQEIAIHYQDIIKRKTIENETYEQKLREKEKELVEMASKCAKLQIKIADFTDIPKSVIRSRKNSEREENLLANLVFDNDGDIQSLNRKIAELEGIIDKKEKQMALKDSYLDESSKKLSDYNSKLKRSEAQMNKLKEQYRKLEKEGKAEANLSKTIKKLEADLQVMDGQYSFLKEKCARFENEKVKKECENISLLNKIKKLESELMVKEQKLAELEKIIQSNVGAESGDLLEKSIYLEKIDQRDLHILQEEKQKLEEELLKQREEIFHLQKDNESFEMKFQQLEDNNDQLKKEIETLLIHNQSMQITLRAQQFEKYKIQAPSSPLKKLLEEGDCLSQNQDDHLIRDELQQFKNKYEESQNLLKIQNKKTFEENRKALKLSSQLNYFKQQLADRESKYEKLRKQFEETKFQNSNLQQTLQLKESDLQVQKKINAERIREIEAQWHQFEQDVKNNYDEREDLSHASHEYGELRNSHNFSEASCSNYKNTYKSVNAQNEKLLQNLRQAEKIIEVQKQMQERIINEYRMNVERIKCELREKTKAFDRCNEQNQTLKKRIKMIEQNENRFQKVKKDEKDILDDSQSLKIIELEMELGQMREIASKREEMEQQLYHQISEKQRDLEDLATKLTFRQRKIDELQDLLQLKQMNIGSHISNAQHKPKMRESFQSHNSLRYSMLSNNTNRDKTIELDLSQVGESFYDHNQSMISNVSEVFARQQFPYEKMQLKRIQQRRLFEKTAAYIKSLKKAIDEKNKRIKLLEKKIQSLRNSQLVRKDIYDIKTNQKTDFEPDTQDIFKDYYSVQLQTEHSRRYKFKQLEHETKLTIEQNNLLNNQIQSMQDELIKAEEQEDSLMKLKDLYKDEIKSLIKQNQDQIKLFQEEIKKQKQKFEQSQSVQKMEALKQIFLKIIASFIALQNEGTAKPRKKQQKKKEIEDFLKVCCNLFNYENQIREKLLGDFRQLKR